MTVRFTVVDAFCDELRTDAEHVERGLVRLGFERRPGGPHDVISVIATARIAGEIVELAYVAGELWGFGHASDEDTKQRAEAAAQRIRDLCDELGFTVRGGQLVDGRTKAAI